MEISVEDIDKLPRQDIGTLQIAFNGRYHIEKLLDILEDAIQDFKAQMRLPKTPEGHILSFRFCIL